MAKMYYTVNDVQVEVREKSVGGAVKLFLLVLLCIVLLAAVVYCTAWAVTGKVNPAEWGTAQEQPDGAENPDDNGTENDGNDSTDDAPDVAAAVATYSDDIVTMARVNPDPFDWWCDNFSNNSHYQNAYTNGSQTATIPLKDKTGALIANIPATVYCFKQEGMVNSQLLIVYNYFVYVSIENYSDYVNFEFVNGSPITGEYSVNVGVQESIYAYGIYNDEQHTQRLLTASQLIGSSYISCVYRPTYPLPAAPEREGHTFTGWYYGTDDDCNGNCTQYTKDVIYEDTKLHAHFVINEYVVIFDSQGGNKLDSIVTEWNTTITPPTPSRTGYNFLGWYKSDGTQFDDSEAIKSNVTLTARWEKIKLTVTFYVDGEVYATVTVEYGSVLSDVADAAGAYAVNILSFKNVNSETPTSVASEMLVTDDMTVNINNPTLWQKIINSKYLPYAIGGVCAFAFICIVVGGVVSAKKKKA